MRQLSILLLLSVSFLTVSFPVGAAKKIRDAREPSAENIRAAVEDLHKEYGDRYPGGSDFLKQLKKIEAMPDGEDKTAALKELRRKALLANPILDFEKILMIRRKTKDLSKYHKHMTREGYAGHLSPQSKTGRQWKRWEQWGYNENYDGVMAQYHELIHGVDVAVGRIRETLKEKGLDDNTVIIFTSDNGFLNGAHGFGGKVLPLEESSGAPLMIYDPRAPQTARGRRSKALTGNIDFAPTILQLAGLPVPEHMDGVSLLPLIADPKTDVREHMAFIQAWPRTIENTCLTVLTKDWKYTYWWYGGKGMQPVEELFNTERDPLELQNLAGDPQYAEVMDDLRARYDRELALWKEHAVSYNDYKRFGVLFDRTVPWTEKMNVLETK